MARRPPSRPTPQAPVLSADQLRRRIERLAQCVADLEKFDPSQVQKRFNIPAVIAIEAAVKDALAAAFGESTPRYERYVSAADLDQGPVVMSIEPAWGRGGSFDHDVQDAADARRYLTEGKERSIQMLRGAIRALQSDLDDMAPEAEPPKLAKDSANSIDIFVVHGHDDGAREAVARFLEKLGFRAIILHEQANQGRTVIEKVEAHSDVNFAVVLISPDDEGCIKGGKPEPRARQNVLLELGYFIGKLGRPRVCTLKVGDVEIPSDWRGVIDEPFDSSGAWKQTLARELDAAEYAIDWNKVMRG